MVGRAFLEALRFGATGGAVLGLRPAAGLVSEGFLLAGLTAVFYGALVGAGVAYFALVLAGMSADAVSNRWVGTLVAFCVAFAISFAMFWFWVLGVAAYAAIVAWFRLPRIVGCGLKCGKPVHEGTASVGD
jgi:lysylphosphatidylglycerol synthetase-like protein (DUF2156 family)